ncbi:MAG: hypothetical protein BWY42_00850 [Candidatus Omnitrophica bacterium ADurb.Bin277]|nr:MAG: hypothetical protein BWY42_00850 [Candidatus Omnitrophica bacterium ADurb.Bin277]
MDAFTVAAVSHTSGLFVRALDLAFLKDISAFSVLRERIVLVADPASRSFLSRVDRLDIDRQSIIQSDVRGHANDIVL